MDSSKTTKTKPTDIGIDHREITTKDIILICFAIGGIVVVYWTTNMFKRMWKSHHMSKKLRKAVAQKRKKKPIKAEVPIANKTPKTKNSENSKKIISNEQEVVITKSKKTGRARRRSNALSSKNEKNKGFSLIKTHNEATVKQSTLLEKTLKDESNSFNGIEVSEIAGASQKFADCDHAGCDESVTTSSSSSIFCSPSNSPRAFIKDNLSLHFDNLEAVTKKNHNRKPSAQSVEASSNTQSADKGYNKNDSSESDFQCESNTNRKLGESRYSTNIACKSPIAPKPTKFYVPKTTSTSDVRSSSAPLPFDFLNSGSTRQISPTPPYTHLARSPSTQIKNGSRENRHNRKNVYGSTHQASRSRTFSGSVFKQRNSNFSQQRRRMSYEKIKESSIKDELNPYILPFTPFSPFIQTGSGSIDFPVDVTPPRIQRMYSNSFRGNHHAYNAHHNHIAYPLPITNVGLLTKDIDYCVSLLKCQRTLTGRSDVVHQRAVQRISDITSRLWPNSIVEVYGSVATGMWLCSSDLDVVICNYASKSNEPQSTTNFSLECLQELTCKLVEQTDFMDVKCITTVSMPVIKARLSLEKNDCTERMDESTDAVQGYDSSKVLISIDITLGSPFPGSPGSSHTGIASRNYAKHLLSIYPTLSPLSLLLKHYLSNKGLNDTYSGGLSSYSLLLLLTGYLQMQGIAPKISTTSNSATEAMPVNPSVNRISTCAVATTANFASPSVHIVNSLENSPLQLPGPHPCLAFYCNYSCVPNTTCIHTHNHTHIHTAQDGYCSPKNHQTHSEPFSLPPVAHTTQRSAFNDPRQSIADQLHGFLNFYAHIFDFSSFAICTINGCGFSPIPPAFRGTAPIVIIDPINPLNNVAQASFSFPAIKMAFSSMLNAIFEQVPLYRILNLSQQFANIDLISKAPQTTHKIENEYENSHQQTSREDFSCLNCAQETNVLKYFGIECQNINHKPNLCQDYEKGGDSTVRQKF